MPDLHENPDEHCKPDWWLSRREDVYLCILLLLATVLVLGLSLGVCAQVEKAKAETGGGIMKSPLNDVEQFIFGQALAEVKGAGDIERVMEKVEGTVLALNKRAMKTLRALAEQKVRLKEARDGN